MLRCDPEDTDALVAEPHARPVEMRGSPARGWLRVDAEGASSAAELATWVGPAVGYARSLGPG